jgi:hypothetical protein
VEVVLPVARLILAAPFAVAGIVALVHPLRLRRTAAAAVTLVDLGVAIGLSVAGTAWFSALVALCALLVRAAVAVAWMTRRGPDSEHVAAVLRSAGAAIPAGIILADGYAYAGPSIPAWLAEITTVQKVIVATGLVLFVILSRRATPVPVPVRPARAEPQAPALIRSAPELTIGMPTYNDFDGVYFTIQALRLYHDLDNVELLVVDNFGDPHTRDFVQGWVKGTYVLADDAAGTAYAKNMVFEKASGAAVLCCDSHVLFEAGVIARLKEFHRADPECADLLQGPLVYDDGVHISTHFEPVWREQMWGIWATDSRGLDPDGEPFEIGMQGLGAFSCRVGAWPGFHPGFRGFGGEEGYLHEKVRRAGGRCLCLPWLRWAHRFGRPGGVPYPLTVEDKLRNYLLGYAELGLDPAPVLDHFAGFLAPQRIQRVVAEAHGRAGTVRA